MRSRFGLAVSTWPELGLFYRRVSVLRSNYGRKAGQHSPAFARDVTDSYRWCLPRAGLRILSMRTLPKNPRLTRARKGILSRARKDSRAEFGTLTFDPLSDRERGRSESGLLTFGYAWGFGWWKGSNAGAL